MFWEVLQKYSSASFKRATGIHRPIFEELVQIIRDYKILHRKDPTKGRKASLSIENQLLMVLMYLREYRTQYHIGITYGLSESSVSETIKEIENIIIQDSRYYLPGKKTLFKSENEIEVVLIDVSESPIERPKKTASLLHRKKEKAHSKNTDSGR